MKETVKKLINYRFDRYEELEKKLEKLALKGLFLEEGGQLFWTFRKGPPKKLKYTVTYFSEGSVFNPGITDNQQTYFDYAEAAGWKFVTQLNQMQIFYSEIDNPIPFETDEKEKFENIRKCMKKSFIPSMTVMGLVFLLNLMVQLSYLLSNPIDYFSDPMRLTSSSIYFTGILFYIYSLLTYFIWSKRSKKSIDRGGKCVKNSSVAYKILDIIFILLFLVNVLYSLFYLFFKIGGIGVVITIAQFPILLIVFGASIKYLKKKKVSATKNKLISITVLIIGSIAYVALLAVFIMEFGLSAGEESNYQTIDWQISETESDDYRLYSDNLPLTCEDLYGSIDYDYYSYEEDSERSLFLSKINYQQDTPPDKEGPPEIEYEILKPRFNFVYQLAKKDLLKISQRQEDTKIFKPIENNTFETLEAYQSYYEGEAKEDYLLFFDDKIIELKLEEPLSSKQISIIKEKLDM